jgi:hypothetical protein
MQCPKCGLENDEKLKFCRACGGALAANMPTAPEPTAPTVVMPAVTPAAPPASAPPVVPPAAPPVAPMPVAPPAPAPPPVYAAPTAPTAPRNNTAIIIAIVAVAFGLLLLLTIAGIAAWTTMGHRVSQTVSDATKQLPTPPDANATSDGDNDSKSDSTAGAGDRGTTRPDTEPVPSSDPVAEATVVLEKYLAADLGNDGAEMRKYLGGQALARFNPDVVGQEDLTVHSKTVQDHTVKDDNTIEFQVKVEWSPADSTEVKTETQTYVLKRTERGWLIFSTPEFPEE